MERFSCLQLLSVEEGPASDGYSEYVLRQLDAFLKYMKVWKQQEKIELSLKSNVCVLSVLIFAANWQIEWSNWRYGILLSKIVWIIQSSRTETVWNGVLWNSQKIENTFIKFQIKLTGISKKIDWKKIDMKTRVVEGESVTFFWANRNFQQTEKTVIAFWENIGSISNIDFDA